MIIKEITISLGATINTGNYENKKFEVSATAQLVESDVNVDAAFSALETRVKAELQTLVDEIKPPRPRATPPTTQPRNYTSRDRSVPIPPGISMEDEWMYTPTTPPTDDTETPF